MLIFGYISFFPSAFIYIYVCFSSFFVFLNTNWGFFSCKQDTVNGDFGWPYNEIGKRFWKENGSPGGKTWCYYRFVSYHHFPVLFGGRGKGERKPALIVCLPRTWSCSAGKRCELWLPEK